MFKIALCQMAGSMDKAGIEGGGVAGGVAKAGGHRGLQKPG